MGKRGYHTEFLTTAPLSFLKKGEYLKDIGFEVVTGRNELKAFREAPKFTFHSPADEVLYQEALKRLEILRRKSGPFFLTILTVSSHRPMKDPLGRGDNQDSVWNYVDKRLGAFYDELVQKGFFRDGILLITSDHRKMYPVLESEKKKYGDSAGFRIPLVVIGVGIPKGRSDNRLFQQSDLFRMLDRVSDSKKRLSEVGVYVERYAMHYTKTSAFGMLRLVAEDGQVYRAKVQDQILAWVDDPLSKKKRYENIIHRQRASHQLWTSSSGLGWKPLFPEEDRPRSSGERIPAGVWHGLNLEIYSGVDLDGLLRPDSERYVDSAVIQEVDYRELEIPGLHLERNFSLNIYGNLYILEAGVYWFRVESDDGAGLAIDHSVVIDEVRTKAYSLADGRIFLEPGRHRIDLRYFQAGGGKGLKLLWKRPGSHDWQIIPGDCFIPMNEGHLGGNG